MQVQVDIEFDELVKIVKGLPAVQLRQLKAEIDRTAANVGTITDLEHLLLNGPTATEKQLETIAKNRKSINGGRTTH